MHHDGVPARCACSNEKLTAWQTPKFKVKSNSSPEIGLRRGRPHWNTVTMAPECRANKAIAVGISDQQHLLADDGQITHQGNIRVRAGVRSPRFLQGEQDRSHLG